MGIVAEPFCKGLLLQLILIVISLLTIPYILYVMKAGRRSTKRGILLLGPGMLVLVFLYALAYETIGLGWTLFVLLAGAVLLVASTAWGLLKRKRKRMRGE